MPTDERSPVELRLRADHVITCDDRFAMHSPGVIDVAGDRISWVGPASDAPLLPPGARKMELGGLLFPGLVNTHGHSPMTLLRGVGEGLPLDRWLREAIWPREANLRPDDVYFGMLLACDELLRCGVTTSCETYFHDNRVVDACVEAGLRCVVAPGILDVPDGGQAMSWQCMLDAAGQLHADADGRAGLVTIGLGPHAAYTLPTEALEKAGDLARELDTILTIHVAETEHEGQALEELHGMTVPALLADLGVLDARVLAAHAIWLTDADMELFRAHEVAVAHCPQSNSKLGSGIARLGQMLDAGIRVGLGTDGPASNNDLDLWEEMRLAPLLVRATSGDATAIDTVQAIRLATSNGAAALGMNTGSLEAGRLADIIHLRTDDPRFVPVTSPQDLVSHLLWSSSSHLVTDVWVGGRHVVSDGICLTVDAVDAMQQVQDRAERLELLAKR